MGGNSALVRAAHIHGCGGADGRVDWPGAVPLKPGAIGSVSGAEVAAGSGAAG